MGDGSGRDRTDGHRSRTESDDGEGRTDSDDQHEGLGTPDSEGPSTARRVVIGVSVAFTVLLFAYAGWQMVTPPQTDVPRASIVGTEAGQDGSVAVTVRLRNPKDVGLITATVESNCSSPPARVEFSFVPASTTRTGTLVCPPGTTDPTVSVASWVSR